MTTNKASKIYNEALYVAASSGYTKTVALLLSQAQYSVKTLVNAHTLVHRNLRIPYGAHQDVYIDVSVLITNEIKKLGADCLA